MSCLRKLTWADGTSYTNFLFHTIFFFFLGVREVVRRVAKQVIDIGRISRSSKFKKKKKKKGREKENTCSCKPVSVMPFTIPYLERERDTYTIYWCLGKC